MVASFLSNAHVCRNKTVLKKTNQRRASGDYKSARLATAIDIVCLGLKYKTWVIGVILFSFLMAGAYVADWYLHMRTRGTLVVNCSLFATYLLRVRLLVGL